MSEQIHQRKERRSGIERRHDFTRIKMDRRSYSRETDKRCKETEESEND